MGAASDAATETQAVSSSSEPLVTRSGFAAPWTTARRYLSALALNALERHLILLVGLTHRADRLGDRIGSVETHLDRIQTVIDDLAPRLTRIQTAADAVPPRLDTSEERLGALEPRLDRLQDALDTLHLRLDDTPTRFDALHSQLELQDALAEIARRLRQLETPKNADG